MRTTVRIDDALLARAKREAVASGRTLAQVIEDALREAFGRRDSSTRRRVELPTFAGRGPRAGVDLDSTAALLDLMEGDAAH